MHQLRIVGDIGKVVGEGPLKLDVLMVYEDAGTALRARWALNQAAQRLAVEADLDVNLCMEPRLDILLVDDDHNDRNLLGIAVDETDLNIWLQSVTDGQEAIDYLKGWDFYAGQSLHSVPDVVMLDLSVRVTGSFDFLDWRRASRSFSSLPVVIFSGSAYMAAIDDALAMGASRFIPKPFGFEGWKAVVREIWDFGMDRRQAAEPK